MDWAESTRSLAWPGLLSKNEWSCDFSDFHITEKCGIIWHIPTYHHPPPLTFFAPKDVFGYVGPPGSIRSYPSSLHRLALGFFRLFFTTEKARLKTAPLLGSLAGVERSRRSGGLVPSLGRIAGAVALLSVAGMSVYEWGDPKRSLSSLLCGSTFV